MRVDNVAAAITVSGQMDLLDTLGRQRIDELVRIETMVETAHIDVIHVQQQQAIGALGDLVDEFPLASPIG